MDDRYCRVKRLFPQHPVCQRQSVYPLSPPVDYLRDLGRKAACWRIRFRSFPKSQSKFHAKFRPTDPSVPMVLLKAFHAGRCSAVRNFA